MKKISLTAAVLAALLFILPVISGCVPDKLSKYEKLLKDYDGAISLSVWTYYNNDQYSAFNKMVKEFNETVGRSKKIYVTHSSYLGVNALTEAVNAAASGKAGSQPMPQLFQTYTDDLTILNDKFHNVAEIGNYFTEEELSNFVEGFLFEGVIDDELLLIPVAKSTEIFMLNKTDWDKFAAAEPDVSLDQLKTAEGIKEVAKKYYLWSGGKAFFGRDAVANYFIQSAASLGKTLFTRDSDGNVVLDRELFQKLYDNYFVPYVKGWFAATGAYRSDSVKSGKIISYVGSSSSAIYFPNKVLLEDDVSYDIDCYVSEMPLFSGAGKYAVQQGAGFAVSKSDEVTEYASCVFLKYITDKQRNIDFAAKMNYLPVVKNALDFSKIKESVLTYQLSKLVDKGQVSEDIAAQEAAKKSLEKQYAAVFSTYEKAIGMAENYTMYSAKPYKGSAGVRKILDYCVHGAKPAGYGLEKLSNADDLLMEINAVTAAGTDKTRDEVINEKLLGNFDRWFMSLQSVINDYLAA